MKIFRSRFHKPLNLGSFAVALALFSFAGFVWAAEKSNVTSRDAGARNLLRSTLPENIQAAEQFMLDTMKASGTLRTCDIDVGFEIIA